MSCIFVSITVTYYRVKATHLTLGITLRLFICGVDCNNLKYNIEPVCESYDANSLGYLVCVRTYSNLLLCIYRVPHGDVITMLVHIFFFFFQNYCCVDLLSTFLL
jgi:hypothetical protein